MVTKKPKGLGLGLEALLGPRVREAGDAPATDGEPHTLALEQLQAGNYQPRTAHRRRLARTNSPSIRHKA